MSSARNRPLKPYYATQAQQMKLISNNDSLSGDYITVIIHFKQSQVECLTGSRYDLIDLNHDAIISVEKCDVVNDVEGRGLMRRRRKQPSTLHLLSQWVVRMGCFLLPL
jgi:hypothetical protein